MSSLFNAYGGLWRLGGAALALLGLTVAFSHWTGRGEEGLYERTWKIAVRAEPPVSQAAPGGKWTGLAPEVLRKAAARRGLKIEFLAAPEVLPHPTAAEAPDLLAAEFSVPEPDAGWTILPGWIGVRLSVVSREEQQVTDLRDLGRRRLALADPKLWDVVPPSRRPAQVKLAPAPGRREALALLCRAQAEALLVEHPFLEQILLDRPTECSAVRLRTLAIPGVEREMRMVAKPEAERLARLLQDEIRDMMADGTYARIAEAWPGISVNEQKLAREEWMSRQGIFYGACIAILAGVVVVLALRRRGGDEVSLSEETGVHPLSISSPVMEPAEPEHPAKDPAPPLEDTPKARQAKGPRFVQMERPATPEEAAPGTPAPDLSRLREAAGRSVKPPFGHPFTKVVPELQPPPNLLRMPSRTGEEPPPAASAAAGKRVLFVEDNPLNRSSGKRLLSEFGLDVEVAPDGKAALEILAREHFDLVIVDYLMPGLDGPSTVRQFRRMEKGQPTPVLMMLIGHRAEHQRSAAEAGADGFLEKPLKAQQLQHYLERLVGV